MTQRNLPSCGLHRNRCQLGSGRQSPRRRRGSESANRSTARTLSGWKTVAEKGSQWVVGTAKLDADNPAKLVVSDAADGKGELVNREAHGVDIYSEQEFGDCTVSLEVMVPKGSNSGIYLMGNYEIQVLDSWGREKVGPGDLGGLYGAAAPKLNAAKAPASGKRS